MNAMKIGQFLLGVGAAVLVSFLPPREEGYEEGMRCNRVYDGDPPCPGTMYVDPAYCRCWISAPCSGCMNSLHCEVCGVYTGPDGDRYDMEG